MPQELSSNLRLSIQGKLEVSQKTVQNYSPVTILSPKMKVDMSSPKCEKLLKIGIELFGRELLHNEI